MEDRWPRARQRKDGKQGGWEKGRGYHRAISLPCVRVSEVTLENKGCLFLGSATTSLPTLTPTPSPTLVTGGRNPKHSEGFPTTFGVPNLRGRLAAPKVYFPAPGLQSCRRRGLPASHLRTVSARDIVIAKAAPGQPGLLPSRPRAQMVLHLLSRPAIWRGKQEAPACSGDREDPDGGLPD